LIEFQGAIHVGVPIKPKKINTQEELLKRYNNGKFIYSEDDEW
jgi:kynurenine--oxoglutarate transaminase/cysteine-S-conjugate beta-lyase/glutamine--phenylpyruvate transaminase/kynurenine aminotransferase